MHVETPDLALLQDVVSDKVLAAMLIASEQLDKIGVRHVLVGGLAVGAHGYPRATKDVDFLVSEDAFEHHPGGFVTMKAGMPIQVNGVLVDFLSAEAMHVAMDPPLGKVGIQIASLQTLVHLKLLSPRQKDASDLIELIKAGAAINIVRDYLQQHAPKSLLRWEQLIKDAAAEE